MTGTIRCLVLRVSEKETRTPSEPARKCWRDLVPGADPYILGLIRKLQREVRDERAAQAVAQASAPVAAAHDKEWDMEYREICIEPETAISLPDLAAAAAGLPPSNTLWTGIGAEDDGDELAPLDRSLRRPR